MAANQDRPRSGTASSGDSASGTSAGSKGKGGKIVDGMQDRFREASEDVKQGAEKASAEIRRGYERASDAAREGYVRMEKDLESLNSGLQAYVKENPAKAVLMAAGAGFLIGLLMRSED